MAAASKAPTSEHVQKVLDKPNPRAYAARVERVQFQRRPVMNIEIATYLLYLTISIALTIWVAHTLHKNGRIFLVDVFHGNDFFFQAEDGIRDLIVTGVQTC